MLSATNKDREAHSASPLSWESSLEASAKKWASGCAFKHSGGDYGENLYSSWSSSTSSNGPSLEVAEKSWYGEVKDYDFSDGDFGSSTGHFTQVVWKDTKKIGCAKVKCDGDQLGYGSGGNAWMIVCQ